MSIGSKSVPPRSYAYQDLPSDVASYQILSFGDLAEIAAQRNLNRAARQRYLDRLPEITREWDMLIQAIRTQDVGLFRDWMNANNGDIGSWDIDTFAEVLNEIADHEPRFLAEAMRYPRFRQDLRRHLEEALDPQAEGDVDLYGEDEDLLPPNWVTLANLLPAMMRFPILRQDYILPAMARNPNKLVDVYELAGLPVFSQVLTLIEQARIPLRGGLRTELIQAIQDTYRQGVVMEDRQLARDVIRQLRHYPAY